MKQSAKRLTSVFFAFIFLLAAIVLFFDLVQPEYASEKSLQGKVIGEQSYLTSQTAFVKQVQTTLNNYQNSASSSASVALALPSGEDVAGALAQIQGIAANTGIAITNISASQPQLQVPTAPQGGSSASSTSSVKPIGSFTFTISATGSYEGFKNFIQELESNIRIFDVQTLSLQAVNPPSASGAKTAASRDMFNYSLTVATYYQPQ
jgi:Tfp pilus assembly protein PilO